MAHPRVEEVEDSDVDMSDPSDGDIDDFDEADILRRVQPRGASSSAGPPSDAASHLINPAHIPSPAYSSQPPIPRMEKDASKYANWQCIYPIYFDASRSRAEGRRVSKSLAIKNPLATEIVNACAAAQVPVVLEMGKSHPQDWANPGRVKVTLQLDTVQRTRDAPAVKNKHHLYVLIASYLKAHPVGENSPSLRMRVGGVPASAVPAPDKPWPRPAVPRGWKMNEFLPYLSPAMTGGGVSENFFKDIMKEMQGGGDPMAALQNVATRAATGGSGSGGGGPSQIEEKKGGKKKGKGKA